MGIFKDIEIEKEDAIFIHLDELHQRYLDQEYVPDEFSLTLPNFELEEKRPRTRLQNETRTALIRFLKVP